MESHDGKLRILFVTQDKFPPFRPAAKAIFAGELTEQGHEIDWLIQAQDETAPFGRLEFGHGVAHVAPSNSGTSRWPRLLKYWWDFKNDLKVFRLAKTGRYSLIQVKDRYLSAAMALWAARRSGIPLYYWLAYPHPEAPSTRQERTLLASVTCIGFEVKFSVGFYTK